jgi:hypothetical protein
MRLVSDRHFYFSEEQRILNENKIGNGNGEETPQIQDEEEEIP